MAVRYDTTPHGVMVQHFTSSPTAGEWTALLEFLVAHKDTVRAVISIVPGDYAPTSRQRAELAEALKKVRPRLPFALLTNSIATRGVLTAINWLTRKQDESRAFPLDGLEPAMTFLALNDPEKAAVRWLAASL